MEYLEFQHEDVVIYLKKKVIIPENEWNRYLLSSDLLKFNEIHHVQKKQEFLNLRALRNAVFGLKDVYYNSYGAPEIADLHISFSHTNEYVAIGVSREFILGMDIEETKEKILKLVHKFIHKEEENWLDKTNFEEVARLWSIKEAMFKHYQKGNVIFGEDLLITPYEEDLFNCQINVSDCCYNVKVKSFFLGNLVISFTYGKVTNFVAK